MNQTINQRLLHLAAEVGWICNQLPGNRFGNQIADQLIRSGTSPGPNYEEACAAESRKDFIHKMSISLKELRETLFWLRLVSRSELISSGRVSAVQDECEQLCKIFGQSVTTARRNDPTQKAWRNP